MSRFRHLNLKRAEACIEDITNRGKLPIIAGGTGLYIQSLLYNYAFEDETISEEQMKRVQAQLEELKHYNNGELHQYLASLIVTLQKIFIQIIEKEYFER